MKKITPFLLLLFAFISYEMNGQALCDGDTIDVTVDVQDMEIDNRHAKTLLTADNTIKDGGKATYKAGTSITLNAGFKVELGGEFSASIEDCILQEPFVTKWVTTSTNESITIPTFFGEIYNYTVDWGDMSTSTYTSDGTTSADATHEYSIADEYTVTITGTFPRIYFNNSGDKDKIEEITNWGTIVWSSMESAFSYCVNLNVTAGDTPDLDNVKSMHAMFLGCTSLDSFSFSEWDVSNVEDMSALFQESSYNRDLEWGAKTSKVKNMSRMFKGATKFDEDVGGWHVDQVTNMSEMFAESKEFNQLLNWADRTQKVENMNGMFKDAEKFDRDLSAWDLSSVTDMSQMFQGTLKFNTLPDWGYKTEYVTNMSQMFEGAALFNQDISGWDVGSVTDMSFMFSDALTFNLSLGNWDIKSITNMTGMLDNSNLSVDNYDNTLMGWKNNPNVPSYISFGALNLEYCNAEPERLYLINAKNWTISGDDKQSSCQAGLVPFKTTWDMGTNGGNISIPVYPWEVYSYDVDWESDGIWDDTNVQGSITHLYTSGGNKTVSIRGIFPRIYFLNATGEESMLTEVNQWGTISWRSMNNAFEGASRLRVLATDAPDLTYVTDLSSMFKNCSSFNDSINHWDVSRTTDMTSMFAKAYSFDKPLNHWDVSNVTSMAEMFSGRVVNLAYLSDFDQDISMWDVGKVEDMGSMFFNAKTFNRNLSAWNVENVTDMSSMFHGATSFNGDLFWGEKVKDVVYMDNMFRRTPFNKDISGWNVSSVQDMSYMFAETSSFNLSLNAWGNKTASVTNMKGMFSEASNFNKDISGWNVSNVVDMGWMFYNAGNFNQDLGNWDVKNVQSMDAMLSYSDLSRANYEATLIGWENLHTSSPLQSNVTLGALGRTYCTLQAIAARNTLTNLGGLNWSIVGDNDSCARTLSTEDVAILGFKIFPNPVQDKLFLAGLSDLPNYNVQISDITGRLVLSKRNKKEIDVSGLRPGVYFLQVLGKKKATKKFIKL